MPLHAGMGTPLPQSAASLSVTATMPHTREAFRRFTRRRFAAPVPSNAQCHRRATFQQTMAHRNNDIFGTAVEAPRRAPSSYRPTDSDIFSARENSQRSGASAIKTVFPGTSGDAARATPRGDHGRSIHDSNLDLGGGYGNAARDHGRPSVVPKHAVQENDKAAGTRGPSVLVKQTDSHNIFGGASALREVNQPAVPSTAGMTGKERRNTIAAWRNGKPAQ